MCTCKRTATWRVSCGSKDQAARGRDALCKGCTVSSSPIPDVSRIEFYPMFCISKQSEYEHEYEHEHEHDG